MKKSILLFLSATFLIMVTGPTSFSQRKSTGPCVGGAYDGHSEITATDTCTAMKFDFIMNVFQATAARTIGDESKDVECSPEIQGTIKLADNTQLMKFSGTVRASGSNRCYFSGVVQLLQGGTSRWSITLSNNQGKWNSTEGTFINSDGCGGTVTLKQR